MYEQPGYIHAASIDDVLLQHPCGHLVELKKVLPFRGELHLSDWDNRTNPIFVLMAERRIGTVRFNYMLTEDNRLIITLDEAVPIKYLNPAMTKAEHDEAFVAIEKACQEWTIRSYTYTRRTFKE